MWITQLNSVHLKHIGLAQNNRLYNYCETIISGINLTMKLFI